MEISVPPQFADFDWTACSASAFINGVNTVTSTLRPKNKTPKTEEELAKSQVLAIFEGPGVYIYLARCSAFAPQRLR